MNASEDRQLICKVMIVLTRTYVVVYCSSNDAFTNQHSLIPPSFGGPQIHVALPRVPRITTSESVTTVSHDSQSTTQTVMSSDIPETGHDVVKDLDDMTCQQPDELMSAAEESSMSAEGAGFDAELRRASAPEAGQMCVDMKYVDTPVAVENSDSLRNGHTACSTTWNLLNPGLSKVASDSSIASSVSSLLDGTSMDISGLVCRTAAVAGHSSFKTHALTDRPSDITDTMCSIDDSNVSLTDKSERRDDDDDSSVTSQHFSSSSEHNVSECSAIGRNDNVMQEHCVQ